MSRYCDICGNLSLLKPLTLTEYGAMCDSCLEENHPAKFLERVGGFK